MSSDTNILPWVLLAEDSVDDVQLFRRAFRSFAERFALKVAETGSHAVELLESEPPPQVAFLDSRMPQLDGLGVLRWVRERERFNAVPIVLLTSATEIVSAEVHYGIGACSFIRKPVDFEDYMATMRSVLEYWLTVNHNPRLA